MHAMHTKSILEEWLGSYLRNKLWNPNYFPYLSVAIFKARIWWMRTRIRRMRRTWQTRWIWQIRRTWRIPRIQRIWWIQRIQRIWRIALAIFKRFLNLIYSPTKGFIISSKLSPELYLADHK